MNLPPPDHQIPGVPFREPDPGPMPPDAGFGVEELDDGSAMVEELAPERETTEDHHGANLAVLLPEHELSKLATDLLRRVENDRESRKKRDEQYAEGLRRSGLDGSAPGGATFEGASRAVHPMLAEACVDFAASALRELLPPEGPVRTRVEGEQTEEKLAVAERQRRLLSWQLTEQVEEFVPDMEQLLSQLPMGGSQYVKFWRDRAVNRVVCEFVPIDDMLLPAAASGFRSAARRTHVQRLTRSMIEERVESGFYRDLRVVQASGVPPETTKSADASARIEGKTPDPDNLDEEVLVYEIDVQAKLSVDEDERRPYLISIDERSGAVLSVYRNWAERDQRFRRLDWAVEFGFVPWRGAYRLGLPHLIGGLAVAATGSLRALLDSAHINNAATLLKLKGVRVGGQSTQAEITQISEIEGPPGVDDVRKLAMPFPFNPPSVVLYQLLGWLTDAAKGVVTTAEEKIAENAGKTMPVGTTLALIEQGSRVMSSIHTRMHRSMQQVLRIVSRLNAESLTPEEQAAELNEVLATREDFAKGTFVTPSSDPNIFSETQRYAQNQTLLQLSSDPRVQYDIYQIHRRMLRQMRIPDPEQVLPEPRQPQEMNSAAENVAVLMRRPVIAFPHQDQLSHIEAHVRFVMDPILVGGVGAAVEAFPAMLEHLRQHLGFLYVDTIQRLVSEALGGAAIGPMFKNPAATVQIDRLIATASALAHAQLRRQLQPLGPVMQRILAQIQAMRPPMPMDPSQVAMLDSRRQSEKDARDAEAQRRKFELDAQRTQSDAQLRAEEAARKARKDEQDAAMRMTEQAAQEEKDAAELALRAEEQRLREEIEKRREMNEAAKFALQLREDSLPGNQVAGV